MYRTLLVMVMAIGAVTTTATVAGAAPNSTATPSPSPTATAPPPQNGSAIQIDPALRLRGYSVRDGTLFLHFSAEVTRVIRLVARGECDGGGVCRPPQKTLTLAPGTTTVRWDYTEISVASPDGLVIIDAGGGGWNPFAAVSATAAWFSGAAVACLMFALAAYRIINHDPDPVQEVRP